MEHSDTRAAAASADRGIADDTDRTVGEQSDIIESNSQGRGTALGDNTELERENNESVYSRIQDGELNGSAVSVQTQSVHRDIRTSDGGNGSFDGRGTDRDIGTSMDKVYGEESPDISRGNEISEEVPDSSSLGGQESGRILGDTGQGVRQDESTSDRGLREDTGLGTGETLLHRQHSDEGSNLSSSNRAVSDNILLNIIKGGNDYGSI